MQAAAVHLSSKDKVRKVKTEGRLFYGCAHGDVDLVRSQLDAGLDANAWWGDLGYVNSHSGSFYPHYDEVPADAITRARDWGDDGSVCHSYRPFLDSTPLHTAIQHTSLTDNEAGGLAVIRLLLERGADPNTKAIIGCRSDGKTPLRAAVTIYRVVPTCLAIARLLLDFGADVNERHSGKTILFQMAEQQNPMCEVASLLLERGADVRIGNGNTPLYRAIQAVDNFASPAVNSWVAQNRLAFARVLLAHGASVELGRTNGHGKITDTPLYHACLNSCVSAARLLLAHGADFDRANAMIDFKRVTPLSVVRERGHLEMNALFDAYLKHYWRLRVKLRVFGRISEHLLDLHVAPYVIGDGVLSKKRS